MYTKEASYLVRRAKGVRNPRVGAGAEGLSLNVKASTAQATHTTTADTKASVALHLALRCLETSVVSSILAHKETASRRGGRVMTLMSRAKLSLKVTNGTQVTTTAADTTSTASTMNTSNTTSASSTSSTSSATTSKDTSNTASAGKAVEASEIIADASDGDSSTSAGILLDTTTQGVTEKTKVSLHDVLKLADLLSDLLTLILIMHRISEGLKVGHSVADNGVLSSSILELVILIEGMLSLDVVAPVAHGRVLVNNEMTEDLGRVLAAVEGDSGENVTLAEVAVVLELLKNLLVEGVVVETLTPEGSIDVLEDDLQELGVNLVDESLDELAGIGEIVAVPLLVSRENSLVDPGGGVAADEEVLQDLVVLTIIIDGDDGLKSEEVDKIGAAFALGDVLVLERVAEGLVDGVVRDATTEGVGVDARLDTA